LLASSLISAVVQKILDEAVAVTVSSSDDFLLRFRTRSILLGLGIFSKIAQETSLRNALLDYSIVECPFGLSHRCHQKFYMWCPSSLDELSKTSSCWDLLSQL